MLLVLLALLLVQIRNWFGLWSVLVSAFVVFGVSWWLPAQAQSAFAYTVTWFLLLAAPRPVLELQALRWRRGARSSDADQLARLTGCRHWCGWRCSWSRPWGRSGSVGGCCWTLRC